jgi:hypothetical protein
MALEEMDRRKFPRVSYPCMVKVISPVGPQQQFLTHTENIGQGGLRVILKNEIKLFSPVEMEVDLLCVDEHIHPKGRVVWNARRKSVEKIKPMFYDIGIEFTEIRKSDEECLRKALLKMKLNYLLQLLADKETPLSESN